MKKSNFAFKGKEEIDAMSLEQKTRYFQELMSELKQREEELDKLNRELEQKRKSGITNSPDSKG